MNDDDILVRIDRDIANYGGAALPPECGSVFIAPAGTKPDEIEKWRYVGELRRPATAESFVNVTEPPSRDTTPEAPRPGWLARAIDWVLGGRP